MTQLRLFPAPRPLAEKLGEKFFSAAPKTPGVYIMTDRAQRVLYIGSSKNLRARLGSYKNAKPDRAARKIIRLVHEVDSVVWETCPTPEAALARETELLRRHRPRFNVANTYPAPERYFVVRWNQEKLILDCVSATGTVQRGKTALEQVRVIGPCKSSVLILYGALIRLIWAVLRPPLNAHDFPAGFFTMKPPRPCAFEFTSSTPLGDPRLSELLCAFLTGESQDLAVALREAVFPAAAAIRPRSFVDSMLEKDFEVLGNYLSARRSQNLGLSSVFSPIEGP
jgi:predicted GIY-YIG superfamily endonuclease